MEFAIAITVFITMVVGVVALWRRRSRGDTGIVVRQTSMITIPPEPSPAETNDSRFLKCLVCTEEATEPPPQIKRSRGAWDWVRELFAAAPRYRRFIDRNLAPALCKSHAHVADAMVEHYIHSEVRAAQTEMSQRIAIRTAAFEQEGLERMLLESLTDSQKRSSRKPGAVAPLRVLSKTGTDDAADPG